MQRSPNRVHWRRSAASAFRAAAAAVATMAAVIFIAACDDVAAEGDDSPAGTGGVGSGGAASSDVGASCFVDGGLIGCNAPLECIDSDPIGGWVCTKTCDTDAECPSDSLCYIFDNNDGHICARICTNDAECDALNAGVTCKERTSTSPRSICAR